MNCKVRPTSYFLKEVKRLSKRYKSLKDDLDGLVASLHENPLQGVDLGGGLHKVRMAITSKGKGKSGAGCHFLKKGATLFDYNVFAFQLHHH